MRTLGSMMNSVLGWLKSPVVVQPDHENERLSTTNWPGWMVVSRDGLPHLCVAMSELSADAGYGVHETYSVPRNTWDEGDLLVFDQLLATMTPGERLCMIWDDAKGLHEVCEKYPHARRLRLFLDDFSLDWELGSLLDLESPE